MAEQQGTLPLPRLSPAPRMLLVAAPFYRPIADNLIKGALAALDSVGARHELVEVPGSLEIPVAIRLAAETGAWDGYVALGCVIRGETTHYELVCSESHRGITLLGVDKGLAIGNGILTVENTKQAEVRADPAGMDKGGGAAAAALHLVALARRFRGAGERPTPPGGDDDIRLAGSPGPSAQT